MTDISKWPELVRCEGQYVMVPLNAYQMGNLLDALTQARENGDWYCELQDIIGVAMDKAGLNELQSNSGKTFTRRQVLDREIDMAGYS
jgi:hypothetical protein